MINVINFVVQYGETEKSGSLISTDIRTCDFTHDRANLGTTGQGNTDTCI